MAVLTNATDASDSLPWPRGGVVWEEFVPGFPRIRRFRSCFSPFGERGGGRLSGVPHWSDVIGVVNLLPGPSAGGLQMAALAWTDWGYVTSILQESQGSAEFVFRSTYSFFGGCQKNSRPGKIRDGWRKRKLIDS